MMSRNNLENFGVFSFCHGTNVSADLPKKYNKQLIMAQWLRSFVADSNVETKSWEMIEHYTMVGWNDSLHRKKNAA
jgi:hypothetical protein